MRGILLNDNSINLEQLEILLEYCSTNLNNNVSIVNDLNVFPVPDGDTGTNMNMTFQSALKAFKDANPKTISEGLKAFSKGSLLGARGNSGVILSQLIRGFVEGLKEDIDVLEIKDIASGIENSSKVAYNAVMKPTEGTILTVSKDLSKAAQKYRNLDDLEEFLSNVIEEGNRSLENTPEQLAVLKEADVVDAGGKGLMVLYEGALNSIEGGLDLNLIPQMREKTSHTHESLHVESIEFGYCTEFIINLYESVSGLEDKLRNKFEKYGDSILVVGTDDIVKVHMHTEKPGKALQEGLKYGELSEISIDNMRYQHIETLFKDEGKEIQNDNGQVSKYGIITVATGDGFKEIFNSLNVTNIISGGQTMNPSTEEILSEVEKMNVETIFILPNNSNIILSAEQVISMTEKNVYVIPSKSIPEGISAILSFDESLEAEELSELMTSSLNSIKSAEITYSVRNSKVNGQDIEEGELIGIYNKDILSKGQDLGQVGLDLVSKLIDLESDTFISIYYGQEVDEEDALKLSKDLEEAYEDVDIQLLYGGQPVYYYIISIE